MSEQQPSKNRQHFKVFCWTRRLALCSLLLAISGCAAHMREVHQFDPIPRAEVGAEELDPVILPQGISESLKEAEAAYAKVGAVSDSEDDQSEAYQQVRDALKGTDIELSVFVALMETHGSIVDSAAAQSEIADRYRRIWFEDIADGEYARLEIPDPLPPLVQSEIERIQNGYPRAFQRGLDRSYQYRPYIRAELSKAGLPLELEWLAMVESQFTPKIDSWAGAGGMWQFMRPTAQGYDLRLDSYVDERYNWQSATRASIKYLQDLYNFFDGDWPLTITSYNMGMGNLIRTIEATDGIRDIWTLIETPPASSRIKDESKHFYAKFLASVIVGNDPEAYGFEINPKPADSTVRVAMEGMYVLDELDRSLGLQPGTLARMNPDLLQEVTPPAGNYSISVPVEVQARFQKAVENQASTLQARNNQNAGDAQTHRVRKGETIAQIAARYNITQDELLEANQVISPRSLRVGHELRLPGQKAAPNSGEVQLARGGNNSISVSQSQQYRVKRGDTLYDIARAHDVSVHDLQRWNNIGRGQRLLVGANLRVSDDAPTPEPMVASVPERSSGASSTPMRYHTVKRGEYPSNIAQRYNVPLDNLLKWNNLDRNTTIQVGQRLVVAVGDNSGAVETLSNNARLNLASAPSSASNEPQYETITHKVVRGESAGKIAERYNVALSDLLRWNNKNRSSVIRVGEELSIRQPAGSQTAPTSGKPQTHTVARGETLSAIADRYKVALSDLKQWNGKDNRAIVRVGEKIQLSANTASSSTTDSAPAAPTGTIHTVARGESLGKIAEQYDVSLRDLRAWNNKSSSSVIQVGEKLRIEGGSGGSSSGSQVRTHTIAKGETASSIAAKYNVSTNDLLAWNNKGTNDVLRVGEELKIQGAATASGINNAIKHVVEQGETASVIASKYNVPTRELLAWNAKSSNDVIRVGEEFVVYPGGDSGASQNAVTHVVSSGQNPTTIARRYGVSVNDLFKWNKWPNRHVLRIGDEVLIYQ